MLARVVSFETSGRKFPEIHSDPSGNLLITYANRLFPSPALQSGAGNKHVCDCDKQLSRSLCFNSMHFVQKKNLFLEWLPGISANLNEITDVISPRILPIFPEISGNIEP